MGFDDNDPRMKANATASPSSGGPDGNMSRLVSEFRALAHDHLELAALEARLALSSVLRMAIIAIVTALVLASAWLALAGSAALALIGIGMTPALAVLCLAAVNLLLAYLGWMHVRRLSHWIGWPATLRTIRPPPAAEPQRGGA